MSVFCKHCGIEFRSVMDLSMGRCSKNSSGRHELYEGGKKSQYICKHCGIKFPSLIVMSMGTCSRNPTGSKRHEPAL